MMVLRPVACAASIALLAAGLRPAVASVFSRFAVGSSPSANNLREITAWTGETRSGSRRRATTLQLGQDGQSRLVPERASRRGPWGLTAISGLRGGASGEGTEEDADSFEDLDDDDFDDGMMNEEDFGEANFVDRLKQDWRKTPIITRTFFQVSIGIAVIAGVFNANQWPNALLLDWKPAVFKLQLWRLFTPFLYLGPLGLNFLLTTHFAWTYMSQLEKLHYREPHTFVMLLAFGMGSLLLLTLATGGDINSSYTLGHSLSCFLVMVWSRKFAGTKVNVLDMFELPTELLPYFFVAQTLMMEGVVPWVDLSGLLIGYAWQTLSLKGLLKAPKPLVDLFRNNAFLRAEYARAGKEYGQEIPLNDDEEEGPPPQAADRKDDYEEEQDEISVPEKREKRGGEGGRVGVPAGAGAGGRQAAEVGAGARRRGGGAEADSSSQEEEEEEEEGEEEEEEEEEGEGEEEEAQSEASRGSDDEEEGGEEDAASTDGEWGAGGEGEDESWLEEGNDLEDLEEFDEEMESMLEELEGGLDSDSGSFEGEVSEELSGSEESFGESSEEMSGESSEYPSEDSSDKSSEV